MIAIARPLYDDATTVPPWLAVARSYRREIVPRSTTVSRTMRHTRVERLPCSTQTATVVLFRS